MEFLAKMLFQNLLRNVYKLGKTYDKGGQEEMRFLVYLWCAFLSTFTNFVFPLFIIFFAECDCGCLDSASSTNLVVNGGNKTYPNYSSNNSSSTGTKNPTKRESATTGKEISVGVISSSTNVASSAVGSNSLKTAHTKVATSGGHANTQAPSKRSSSGADGDYQLVQHEVLYSLSAEYEVSL